MEGSFSSRMRFFKYLLSIIILVFVLSVCDSVSDPTDEKEKEDNLYVKFYNNDNSEYTITSIQLIPMGIADEDNNAPEGEWSDNILKDGVNIAPGDFQFFNLDIPNLHYSRYRLGVDNGNGNEIMLHEQDGYVENITPTITHWGSDDRTAKVSVVKNESTGFIEINGFSDWAGVD
jgi:hypothetical protein